LYNYRQLHNTKGPGRSLFTLCPNGLYHPCHFFMFFHCPNQEVVCAHIVIFIITSVCIPTQYPNYCSWSAKRFEIIVISLGYSPGTSFIRQRCRYSEYVPKDFPFKSRILSADSTIISSITSYYSLKNACLSLKSCPTTFQ